MTFDKLAQAVARSAGRPVTFIISVALVVLWGVSGPIFGFSDTWQLVINTGTTIVTFLMVFLIQNTQNRDTDALQVKIDGHRDQPGDSPGRGDEGRGDREDQARVRRARPAEEGRG